MPQSPSPIAPAAALPMEEASAGGTKDWETGGQRHRSPPPELPQQKGSKEGRCAEVTVSRLRCPRP